MSKEKKQGSLVRGSLPSEDSIQLEFLTQIYKEIIQ
jgi:hypothetical protein